jgi:hypothetical protein
MDAIPSRRAGSKPNSVNFKINWFIGKLIYPAKVTNIAGEVAGR